LIRRPSSAEELNLVPIMNLVTILIPFLLMGAQFVEYSIIESSLPSICASCDLDAKLDEPLSLTVGLTSSGFVLDAKNSGLSGYDEPVTVPCLTDGCAWSDDPAEAFDVASLRVHLTELSDAHPQTTIAVLLPGSNRTYEELIFAMDGVREDPAAGDAADGCRGRCLFPAITIAGGVED
jgi:biopolymer transport protein ExbD